MKYYSLIKLNNWIKNPRIKLFFVYLLHRFNRRYLGVHFDPVNACNLRCKMCYFTDENYVKKLKGIFPKDDLPYFGKAILKRAIKLQIGCGTEPTLYKDLDTIIKLGKDYKVPYISMTTNANNIELNKLRNWCRLGLDEITVSLHGVNKTTYEDMMGRGNFDRFLESLEHITTVKNEFPSFQLRVNYTFNEDNFDQLAQFWTIFNTIKIDTLQIRPIKNMGNTAYQNFSMKGIIPKYEHTHQQLRLECEKRNTTLIAPKLHQLQQKLSINSVIQNFTYCYISPTAFWKEGYDWKHESFNQFSKRTEWGKLILSKTFGSKAELAKLKNESLNYELS